MSSSGVVRPSFEVALDMEEVGPCNQPHGGTFLGHKRRKNGIVKEVGMSIKR